MLGRFPLVRALTARTLVSSGAFAVALAAGVFATCASAQDDPVLPNNNNRRGGQQQQTPPKTGNSREFAKVYQPLAAIANAPTGDFAGAKAQIPALLAAVQNDDDRNLAGSLILLLGNKTNDRALQQQGLGLMLQSGKVPAAQVGQYHFLAGGLAYDANDYAKALAELQAARTAGFQDESLPGLIAESYFKSNQAAAGLEFLRGAIAQRTAAGTAVPDTWLRRGLQVAYENRLAAETSQWAALLASNSPTPANWTAALQVVGATAPADQKLRLDLLRLMSLTGALTTKEDYLRYVDTADPRVMSNEVQRVLAAGAAANLLKPTDREYLDAKRVADERAPIDRRDAPKMMADAQRGTAADALNAGDVLYSLAQYADAEKMYALAVQKGGPDRDTAITRLGIAQAQQGKSAEAKATFAQITSGPRAPLARMWEAYVQTKARG
jgi:hypothetical protein